jgi:hypothetical protein
MTDMTVDSLAAQLRRAGSEALTREVEAVVKRGAVNVKKDWRANAKETAGSAARVYPYSITFDGPTRLPGHRIEAEIGPDKGKRQGALGNLLEYGSVNNPPHNDGKRAADKEQDKFAEAVLKTAAGFLW